MPKVFIIILNWNGCADTIECIESLKKIDYPNYKIVVVDNGSEDGSIDIIPRTYREIVFIETKQNLGFAGGNNVGIKYVLENQADFVLFLNNDTTVEPDFLTKLVEAAEANSRIGIAGPMILFYDEPQKIWFGGGKVNWLRTKGSHIDYGKNIQIYSSSEASRREAESRSQEDSSRLGLRPRSNNKTVDYITGCCLLIKREVIEKIGLLSEDYFLYYEDVDWCLKTSQAGWKSILVPQAKIYHKQSKATGEFSYPYIYYHSRNGLILASRFGCKLCAYLVSFWIFLKQIIKLIIGYKRQWAKPVTKGVMDFWRGKKGKLEGYY